MKPSCIVGIAGPSCSGKTTICDRLKEAIPDSETIHLDNYWQDSPFIPKIPVDGMLKKNLEHPETLDFSYLYKNLNDLKNNTETIAPKYSYSSKQRTLERIVPKEIILVEGFLLFYWEKIRNLLDLKFYVNIDDEEIIKRRIERKRTGKDREQYYRTIVVPEYRKYGLPGKKYAIEIDGMDSIDANAGKMLNRIKGYVDAGA